MTFFGIRNIGTGQDVTSITVTTTTGEIVAANTNRAFILMANTSTTDVFVGIDVNATLNKGILLGRNGGTFVMDATALSTGAINGIVSTGTGTIVFQEFNI